MSNCQINHLTLLQKFKIYIQKNKLITINKSEKLCVMEQLKKR